MERKKKKKKKKQKQKQHKTKQNKTTTFSLLRVLPSHFGPFWVWGVTVGASSKLIFMSLEALQKGH